MKVRFHRAHKVRPADYESLDFGAVVEIDTEVDVEFADMSYSKISRELESGLDDLLASSVDRALRLGGTIEESHLWDFYGLD